MRNTQHEAADILDKAAAHIETVGYTTWGRWDDHQEKAGTPRGECSVDVLGAIAYVAHGDPETRLSDKRDAANDARCAFAWHFRSNTIPVDWTSTQEAVNALREAATALRCANAPISS